MWDRRNHQGVRPKDLRKQGVGRIRPPHITLRNLGTNAVAGAKRQDSIAIARQNEAMHRAKALLTLKKAGADVTNIHKTGASDSALGNIGLRHASNPLGQNQSSNNKSLDEPRPESR